MDCKGCGSGKKRTLYIHPAYGYGALTTLPPCSGLIIKADLIELDEIMAGLLPALIPLDISWLQESALMADIESSLEQQPRYLGFLYRNMTERVEGLDQSEIIGELYHF